MEELKLSGRITTLIDSFISEVRSCYEMNLVSVILYGSAARNEFMDEHSNINLLVVVADATLAELEKAAPLLRKAHYDRIAVFILTTSQIEQSLDVFPIEFLDIMENYRVIAGTDVLTGLVINTEHLRFQCEHELKAKLFSIKTAFLKRGGSTRQLTALLVQSISSWLHLCRNLLRLKGTSPATQMPDMLKQLGEHFGTDTALFLKILALKEGKLRLNRHTIKPLFLEFVSEMEKIVAIVDGL